MAFMELNLPRNKDAMILVYRSPGCTFIVNLQVEPSSIASMDAITCGHDIQMRRTLMAF